MWSEAAALPIHARRSSDRPWRRSSDSAPTGLPASVVRPDALAAIGSVLQFARGLQEPSSCAAIQQEFRPCPSVVFQKICIRQEPQGFTKQIRLTFSSVIAIERAIANNCRLCA